MERQPSRGILFLGARALQVLNSFAHRTNSDDYTDTRVSFDHILDVGNLPDWTVEGETEHPIGVRLTALM